jgi:hypothetical protein
LVQIYSTKFYSLKVMIVVITNYILNPSMKLNVNPFVWWQVAEGSDVDSRSDSDSETCDDESFSEGDILGSASEDDTHISVK